MSIKVPQYTIHTSTGQENPHRKFLLPLLLILSLCAGYFGRMFFEKSNFATMQERNEVLEVLNSDYQDKLVQKDTEISVLKTENKVKQQAIAILQKDYKDSIDKQKELHADISFYQRLLSPDAENKGLRVFENQLTQRVDGSFKLNVVLVQKIEKAKEVSGKISIKLLGQTKEGSSSISLNEPDSSQYKFKYFQNISLSFSLPEGFKAEQLVVKLIPKSKKAQSVTQTVEWNLLIN